jgi:glycosyltransferase involved in cell wall biosynthesis
MNKRKKILFIIPNLYIGGAEKVFLNILQNLNLNLLDVTLIVLGNGDAIMINAIPPEIDLIMLEFSHIRSSLLKLLYLIWIINPDTVFSNLSHLNLLIAIIRKFLPKKIKFVARETCIVSEVIKEYKFTNYWNFLYKYFYGRLDIIVCQSEEMKNDLLINFRIPEDNLVIIRNPIDIKGIRSRAESYSNNIGLCEEQTLRLIAVGRLVHQKGFDILLESIKLCRSRKIELTVLGIGPCYNDLRKQADRIVEICQVKFLGFVDNPYDYISQADALVLSSRYEGFPNVILESLACGVPVIATPAPGGVKEIIEKVNGCHLAVDITPQALAFQIEIFKKGNQIDTSILSEFDPVGIAMQYENLFS